MSDQIPDKTREMMRTVFAYAVVEETFRILDHWRATNDPRLPKDWLAPKNNFAPPKECEMSYAWQYAWESRLEPFAAARISADANALLQRVVALWLADHPETVETLQTHNLGESDEAGKIHRPPAHVLVSVAKFILSKATYQRYIEPHVLDIRTEHYEALQAGELRKARWIVIRGYCQALWPLAVAVWGTITALLKLST